MTTPEQGNKVYDATSFSKELKDYLFTDKTIAHQ
jgi:hypothetical protein